MEKSWKGMECKNEACDECKRNCLLIHGKRVSFCKFMIGKHFSKILFFPPRFARSFSHLTNQEIHLEDSSGQQWRVTVGNHSGSLAIRKGWPKFSSEHGLSVGDFLVFHHIHGQRFIVQIFGTSGCEKKFYSEPSKGKKRARTYPEATSQDELLQTTDINSVNKKSKTYAASESEKVTHRSSHIISIATDLDANTGREKLICPAVNMDESFCLIDRDDQYDQGGDRLCLHLPSYEMPACKPLAEGTSSLFKCDNADSNHVETNLRSQADPNLIDVETDNLGSEELLPMVEGGIRETDMVSIPAEDIPLLGQKDENDLSTGIISSSVLKPTKYGSKSDDVSNVTKYQNPWKSTFKTAKETRQVKKELVETATEAYCPARAPSDSGKEPANGNIRVIKSEPADSGDIASLDAVSYSCLQEVDGRDFLELRESWRKHLKKRVKMGRWIIYLRGPDKRIWPTLYHSRSGFEVLTCGWTDFTAAYGLNPGDECLFQLENQLERIFDVQKVQSKMPEELPRANYLEQ